MVATNRFKLQIPSTKLQINLNIQYSMTKTRYGYHESTKQRTHKKRHIRCRAFKVLLKLEFGILVIVIYLLFVICYLGFLQAYFHFQTLWHRPQICVLLCPTMIRSMVALQRRQGRPVRRNTFNSSRLRPFRLSTE